MGIHRLKHTFTAGEISPLMGGRVDFDRYKDGCTSMLNAVCLTQGPATRRSGFKFIFDLSSSAALSMDVSAPVRLVPFVFNELQAYVLVFFKDTLGQYQVVFATGTGLVVSGSTIVKVALGATWDINNFDYAQSGDNLYITQSALPLRYIKRTSHTSWSVVIPTITGAPADWSGTNGYPERITLHQQRLVVAANTLRRQTIWCSKAGDFLNFTAGTADSDAITFTLDSGTQNRIRWILSGKTLNVGTLGNEWTISGNGQTALTPSSVLAQRQTNNGGEANKPLLVGLTTLFVERHGRTINEFVYDYSFDSYKTADISILAPHLTEHYSIVDWTFQQTPDNIIWCVRDDGELLGLTYQREHKVIGWHRHHTQGTFWGIASIPGSGREDEVWVLVRRVVLGVSRLYLEKLAPRFSGTTSTEGRFVDSFVEYSGTAVSSLSGLYHLAGCTVSVLANGAVLPDMQVAADGSITFSKAYTDLVIGLSYTTEIAPYLADIGLQTGTTLGRVQRITNLDIDLYRSLGMVVGYVTEEDGEVSEEQPFRVPKNLTGQALPLKTGWYELSFIEGFYHTSSYFIRQSQPLPLTVRCVVDTVEVY